MEQETLKLKYIIVMSLISFNYLTKHKVAYKCSLTI